MGENKRGVNRGVAAVSARSDRVVTLALGTCSQREGDYSRSSDDSRKASS